MRDRVVGRLQHAARRRAALALGDHVDGAGPAQRLGERRAARRRRVPGAPARAPSYGYALPPRLQVARGSPRRSPRADRESWLMPRSRSTSHKRRQRAGGVPVVDRRGGLGDALAQRRGPPGDEQRRAGVQQHDVAGRARPSPASTPRMIARVRRRRRRRAAPPARPSAGRIGRDARRRSARRRRGTPTPWCSRSSTARRGRRRRARPRRARRPAAAASRAISSVSSGRGTPTTWRARRPGWSAGRAG